MISSESVGKTAHMTIRDMCPYSARGRGQDETHLEVVPIFVSQGQPKGACCMVATVLQSSRGLDYGSSWRPRHPSPHPGCGIGQANSTARGGGPRYTG